MNKLLIFVFVLSGCASTNSWRTDECVELYVVYKQTGTTENEKPTFDAVKSGERKVSCPKVKDSEWNRK